jgi:hypothetical protein
MHHFVVLQIPHLLKLRAGYAAASMISKYYNDFNSFIKVAPAYPKSYITCLFLFLTLSLKLSFIPETSIFQSLGDSGIRLFES